MSESEYRETVSELARKARVTEPTVRTYADAGLLDYIRLSNGVRLFRNGQEARVREILARRMANRGRRTV